MKPDKTMSRVIDGKRYSVASATLIADDCYWDGHNFERHGRNTFLYKTRGGAFFRLNMTQWQGERDTITPLTREEAIELYESLNDENAVPYEQAFDAEVEEAGAGRPTFFGQPMKQTGVWLPEHQIAWAKAQPGGMGEAIRNLLEKAIEAEK